MSRAQDVAAAVEPSGCGLQRAALEYHLQLGQQGVVGKPSEPGTLGIPETRGRLMNFASTVIYFLLHQTYLVSPVLCRHVVSPLHRS